MSLPVATIATTDLASSRTDFAAQLKQRIPFGVWIHCSTTQPNGGRKSLVIWVAMTSE